MKNPGDIVKISGKDYILGERLGGGLEGNVFRIKDLPNYVIKLINTSGKTDSDIESLRSHLKWLRDTIEKCPDLKNRMAAPKALLDDELGYIMVRASEHHSLKHYFQHPNEYLDFLNWCRTEYNLKKRLQIAAFLFHSLEKIHIAGLIFTDLSPNNIMVHDSKNNLVFIDTDNMRMRSNTYISILGTEGYMAPEIYHQMDIKTMEKAKALHIDESVFSNTGKISVDSDIFSAAIIAFELLTLQHPFIGDIVEEGTAEDETAAYRCETDYILSEGTNNSSSQPLVDCFSKGNISTPKLRELFRKTFMEGKQNPSLRPTAKDFFEAFSEAIDMLFKCSCCGVDTISQVFERKENGHNTCWYCEEDLPKQIFLRIYTSFEDYPNRNELISRITCDTVKIETEVRNNKLIELSQIVLRPQENKYLYLRHFEKADKRSEPYAQITLTDPDSREIEFVVLNKTAISDCNLYDINTRQIVPMKDGKKFIAGRFAIIFEVNTTRVGKTKTIGMFYESD